MAGRSDLEQALGYYRDSARRVARLAWSGARGLTRQPLAAPWPTGEASTADVAHPVDLARWGGHDGDRPAPWVAELTGGEVHTDGWLLVEIRTRSGQRLRAATLDFLDDAPFRDGETVGGWRRRLSAHARRSAKIVEVDRAASLLCGSATENYFHLIYDLAVRLELLRTSGSLRGDEHLLVPRLTRDFMREVLTMLEVPSDRLIEVDGPTIVRAGTLITATNHRTSGHVDGWMVRAIHERLAPSTPSTEPPARLYVSRSDTSLRRISNESELIAALEALDIEPVVLGPLSVRRAMERFASAELIVGAHGAGLTNTTFCQPGTRVVELLGEWDAEIFREIAATRGLRHTACAALTPEPRRLTPARARDVRVDVEKVVDVLSGQLDRAGRGTAAPLAPVELDAAD